MPPAKSDDREGTHVSCCVVDRSLRSLVVVFCNMLLATNHDQSFPRTSKTLYTLGVNGLL